MNLSVFGSSVTATAIVSVLLLLWSVFLPFSLFSQTDAALSNVKAGGAQTHALHLTSSSCPCSITIAATHDAPNFDLVVLRSKPNPDRPFHQPQTPTTQRTSPDEHSTYTQLNRSSATAVQADAHYAYHVLHIPAALQITLLVRAAQATKPSTFRVVSAISAVVPASQRSSRCPSVLRPHPIRTQEELPVNNAPQTDVQPATATQRTPHTTKSHVVAPRIVGGDPSGRDLARYLVYFLIPSFEGWRACSGTLVAPRIVITAAHCNVDIYSTAFVGGTRGSNSNGEEHEIDHVKIRGQFQSLTSDNPRRFNYDIAIVYLKADVRSSSRFMKVNVNRSIPVEGSIARAAGYGNLRHQDQTSNLRSVLHQVDIPVVSRSRCLNAYSARGIRIDYDYQVCAGYLGRGGCDSCQGDSGGPLFQYDNDGNPVLIGVVSIGVACADARFPGVYVRTSAHDGMIPEAVTRTSETRAVFSTYTPPRVINRTLLIAAVGGGLIAVVAVIALVVVIAKRRRGGPGHLTVLPTNDGPVIRPYVEEGSGGAPHGPVASGLWPEIGSTPAADNFSTAALAPGVGGPGHPVSARPYASGDAYGGSLYRPSSDDVTANAIASLQPGGNTVATATATAASAGGQPARVSDPAANAVVMGQGGMATARIDGAGAGGFESTFVREEYDPYEALRAVGAPPTAPLNDGPSPSIINDAAIRGPPMDNNNLEVTATTSSSSAVPKGVAGDGAGK